MTVLSDRFWAKVQVPNDPHGCLEWVAGKFSSGYGAFFVDGAARRAHRVAYELLVGPIPEGRQLDHLCRNRACVAPDHLEPVSSRENTLRGAGPTARNAIRTECVSGHPLSGDNLYVRPNGWRECRTCARRNVRQWRGRRG